MKYPLLAVALATTLLSACGKDDQPNGNIAYGAGPTNGRYSDQQWASAQPCDRRFARDYFRARNACSDGPDDRYDRRERHECREAAQAFLSTYPNMNCLIRQGYQNQAWRASSWDIQDLLAQANGGWQGGIPGQAGPGAPGPGGYGPNAQGVPPGAPLPSGVGTTGNPVYGPYPYGPAQPGQPGQPGVGQGPRFADPLAR